MNELTIKPAQRKNMANLPSLRSALATVSLLIMMGCIVATVTIVCNVSIDSGVADLPFNELTSKSIDTRLDLSRSLFQVALLITATLWGLVIAKEDEAQIVFSKPSEVIMFVSASLLLILSVGSHALYLNKVTEYLSDAAASSGGTKASAQADLSLPNIFDQNVNYLFITQITNLTAGVFDSVMTLISAHKLKEK